MLVISSREFRDNQKKYFDKIDAGEQVVVQRGKNVSYRITPVTKDDTLMTEEEFYAMIERSAQQAREGKVTSLKDGQSIKQYLEELCTD
ncbi:MAG: prevent-host-death protein [Muribaculaceae bacterium]